MSASASTRNILARIMMNSLRDCWDLSTARRWMHRSWVRRRIWRAKSSCSSRSRRRVGNEFQCDPVDAVAQTRRRRPVLEDMAQMSATAPAVHLGARQQQEAIGGRTDGVRQRLIEARPTGLTVVFRLRREHRKLATGADERALAFLIVERARAGRLGPVQPQHLVLRLVQDGAPFAVALLDFQRAGGLDIRALHTAPAREQRKPARTRQQKTTIKHG